jgi:hypothetical protein
VVFLIPLHSATTRFFVHSKNSEERTVDLSSLSIRLSACNISASSRFPGNLIWVFFENLSRKFKFDWTLIIKTGTLHEDVCTFIFKVCKFVHHRTIQINHQPDATIFYFIILTFIYSSTCFGRFSAHLQELNDCSGSLWVYLRIVVIVMLCSWSGWPAGWPASPTTNTARLSPRYEGKPRGCHCSHWAPEDGRKNARNM